MEAKKTVALVLGSGAARGHAHIGVIQALEERGYDIVSISGCSIGAIVGGVYAAGKLPEYREWVESLDRMNTLRLLDMSILNGVYVKGDRFFDKVQGLIGTPDIESLPIAYTSVAVDLSKQKESWFQRGNLINAMRASSAIPSLISPVSMNGRMYVDGGVLNPLPIIPAVPADADYIVAVDLNGPAQGFMEPDVDDEESGTAWWQSAKDFFAKSESEELDLKPSYSPESWGRLQTINMMFETMQASLTQYKLAGYPPDLLISIPKDICKFYEFWRAKELIDLGYRSAVKALDKVESPSSLYGVYSTSD